MDGFASRNTWLLESRHELEQLLDAPDFELTGLYAEEFIGSCGPMVPGMADYVSVEVFRSGSAAGPAGSTTFITHRPPQAWPCRETGRSCPRRCRSNGSAS